MKILLYIAAILVAATASGDDEQWNLFKSRFAKSYDHPLEEKARFSIFSENLALIESHNKNYKAGLVSYKMAVNQFADMTKSEFVNMLQRPKIFINMNKTSIIRTFTEPLETNVPTHRNWTDLGVVTEVKDQGTCGAGWSFSAVGVIEGQYLNKFQKLISFSAQNLLDCTRGEYQNEGCNGGLVDNAFNYVQKVGIMTEQDYPYQAVDGTCKFNSSKSALKIVKYYDLESGSEPQLKHAVGFKGPTATFVDATNFAFYSEGIFNDTKCGNKIEDLNHGILVTGYANTKDDVQYWLLKNSWGTSWGENGYMRILRYRDNMCGIATMATYIKAK